jgi:hypothetical protein
MISAPKESILRAGLDASEYTRGAAEIDRANADMASSAAAVERANQSGAAALAAFEETEKRSARAKRELAQSQKVIAAAVERGAITEADASTKLAAAQERYDRTLTQTTEQQRRSTSAQDEMTRSIVTSASSVDRLQASLDKGFASQLRYEQVVDRVNAAMERGRISHERGAQIISLAQQKYMAAATSTAALGAATAAAATSGRSFGAVAQQAGYQIGDFASQVASGGSAVTAFIQQGSQMLGMFGMFGAVAGAALAIGGIAYQMLAAKDAAKGATDEVSALTAEIKRLNEESVKRGGGQPGIRANVMREDLMSERRRLVGMLPATGGASAASSEMQGFVEAQAASEVSRIQGQIDAIDNLIREYDRLVREQVRVDESTAALKGRGDDFEGQKKREAEAIREAARAQEEAERTRQKFLSDVTALENALDPATAATRRWADQQALLLQALDASVISQERYNELIAASDEIFRKATEKNVEYLTGIERQTRENDNLARELGFTFQSAFEDAILRGEKLRGVLAGIAQDIARIILRQTVTNPLASFVMTGLSGALSGLMGGGAGDIRGPGGSTTVPFGGPRALGGPVAAGSAYLVGEEGPELFMPGASGRIVPNGQTSGGTVVNQTINISVGVAQTVRAEIAALMPAIKRQTVDAVADARMRGGSFAAAMGT